MNTDATGVVSVAPATYKPTNGAVPGHADQQGWSGVVSVPDARPGRTPGESVVPGEESDQG